MVIGSLQDGARKALREETPSETSWAIYQIDEVINVLNDILNALGGTTNTTPLVANVSCPTSGTEYNYALPANTKKFILRARNQSSMQFNYTTITTDYITIPSGANITDDNKYSSQTIYFKCSKNGEIVEIITYV